MSISLSRGPSTPEFPSLLPLAERARLAGVRRLVTPCGAGEMVWQVWGAPGAQPPVVLLHGGSGSWTHWVHNIAPLLEAGRQVLVPDLPGFGESAPPATGHDAEDLVEPLAEGLRRLLGPVPVELVGFSFGGLSAGLLLAEHPALARRLVLVGAPAMGVVRGHPYRLKGWRHLAQPQERAEVHRHNLAVLMLHDAAQIDGLALEIHTTNVLRDRMPRRRLFHTDRLARALAHVACPVHAIYGAHDAIYQGDLSALEAALARSARDFRGLTRIDGAGHWVQFEAADAFNAALAAVLADAS